MKAANPPRGDHEPLPALRAVEVTPLAGPDGEVRFVLHDRLRIAPQALGLSAAGYFVLAHLDGVHSCADVQAAFLRHTGMRLPGEQIMNLVRVLDEGLLLEGARFQAAYGQYRTAYLTAEARDNRDRYPPADELRAELEGVLAAGSAVPVPDLRGLIAPHLDYARGAPCYADAYATLARAPAADRYVILGTNHSGPAGGTVVATCKDFLTPLGRARTDVAFIEGLEQRLGASLRAGEEDHAGEHSIELQVHFLQVLAGERSFTIVPILCRAPRELCGDAPVLGGPEVGAFGEALGAAVAAAPGRTVVIAGADLSHLGARFGDPEPVTQVMLEETARSDSALLRLLEERAEAEFVRRLAATDNATRVCSAGGIYVLMKSLPDRPCRLLSYHQAINYEADTHVTCAAMVVG